MSAEEHERTSREESRKNAETGQQSADADNVAPQEVLSSAAEGPAPVEADRQPETSDQRDEAESSSKSEESGGQAAEAAASAPPDPSRILRPRGFFAEPASQAVEADPRRLRAKTRRDFLIFGAGVVAGIGAMGWLLPNPTLSRLGLGGNTVSAAKERLLNTSLRIDDDVAEALYSRNRMVPTYSKSQTTPLRNNYNGATPEPDYIPSWKLRLDGLASGLSASLDLRNLLTRFTPHEQITRLICVEGWSAIAWWAGLRFDDLLRAYPPMAQAKWAQVESAVNLDSNGDSDPYYMSLDLATARHPQTLLATHLNGQPLAVEHGAPLRLLAPVKLGLKNVKAITRIVYTAEEPRDYWAERGYSRYDGI